MQAQLFKDHSFCKIAGKWNALFPALPVVIVVYNEVALILEASGLLPGNRSFNLKAGVR